MSRLTESTKYGVWCSHSHMYECQDCNGCKWYEAMVEKLAHYEDLEEQGKLIVLPCKVGDTVYVVDWDMEDMYLPSTKYWFIYEQMFDVEMIYSIGKWVFLTKEEAEAKLAELKGTKK